MGVLRNLLAMTVLWISDDPDESTQQRLTRVLQFGPTLLVYDLGEDESLGWPQHQIHYSLVPKFTKKS